MVTKDRDEQGGDRLDKSGFPSAMFACFDIDTPSALLARDLDDGRYICTFECADDAYTEIDEAQESSYLQWEVCRVTNRSLSRVAVAGILHKWALTDVPEVFYYD